MYSSKEIIRSGKSYALYRKIRNLAIPIDVQLKLFDSLITPIFVYSCEVWGFENKQGIEKMHLQYCKRILNLRSSTPNFMVYGEIGVFLLKLLLSWEWLHFGITCCVIIINFPVSCIDLCSSFIKVIPYILNGFSMGTCAAQLTCLRKVCEHVIVSDHRLSKPEGFNVSFYVYMW